MRRVKLPFARGLEVEFADRERALRQVYELAERGTRYPVLVFGPEGCGKTAWLRQAAEILREVGYDVLYVNPLHRDFSAYTEVGEVVRRFAEAAAEATGVAQLKLATLAVLAVRDLVARWRRRRVAVLVDEVFQAIGLDRAEVYVKELLGLIEHPPASYESVVAVVATSEGITRRRVGRHRWAWLRPMWNMPREGFGELYEQLRKALGSLPDLEEAWKLTGGNPDALSRLHQALWDVGTVVEDIARARGLTRDFVREWAPYLRDAVEDPDSLSGEDVPGRLREELESRNLVVYDLYSREPQLWVDEPPPGRDLELGIGRYVAWQTPLYREAVRRVLRAYSG